MEEVIKRAEEGNTEAQFQLGLAYYNGEGIVKNYSKAYYWFLKAVEQGNGEAHDWLKNLIKIHVLIDSQRYPMIIKRTDEFQYREAAKYELKRSICNGSTLSEEYVLDTIIRLGVIKQIPIFVFSFGTAVQFMTKLIPLQTQIDKGQCPLKIIKI